MIQRANLRLPFGFTIIENQVPQITNIFTGDDEIIKFEGQEINDQPFEDPMTDFFSWQMRNMKFVPKFTAFIKSMLIDGTGIAKVPYRFKEVNTVRRSSVVDPETGETTVQKRDVLEVTYDGPDLEIIAIHDFYPDWSAKSTDIQAMRGCVHRMFKTRQQLKSSGLYKNLDLLKRSMSDKGADAWQAPYYSDEFKDDFERLNDNDRGAKDGGKIEIWEYWGLWDPKGDGKFEEYLITLANGDVLIRDERNFYDYKFKPFVACPNYVRDNEFYGVPELLAVRPLIKEANTIRNARLDNINLSVNPMYVVDRAAGINRSNLYSRPNGVVWSNDVNGIKPLPVQDPSIGSSQEMGFLQADINSATSSVTSTPQLPQFAKTFGRSATGVEFIQNIANTRVGLKAQLLSELFFREMAWIMMMTNRQFVTDDQWVKLTDPNSQNPFTILPTDSFFRKFDYKAKTDLETGGPQGQLAKMQSVAQFVQALEASQPGSIKMDALAMDMLRPLVGNKQTRYVRTEEEREAMQQRALAAEQAANAAAGQGAPQPNAQGPGFPTQ